MGQIKKFNLKNEKDVIALAEFLQKLGDCYRHTHIELDMRNWSLTITYEVVPNKCSLAIIEEE